MLELRSKQILNATVLIAVTAVTLVMAPYTSIDPINLPKLCTLAFFAVIAVSLVAPRIKRVFDSEFRALVILSALFTIQLFLTLIFSGSSFEGQFYGAYGRNTGALAYISLVFMLVGSALVSDREFLKKFTQMTFVVGSLLIIYGNIQYLGLEPFPFNNAYTVKAPIGTFGNPDFQSAFMGLIAVLAFTMILNTSFKLLARAGMAMMGLVSIIVIYETLAKQGYFAFIAGAGTVATLWLFMTKRKTLAISLGGIGIVGSLIVFLGLINTGPLASYLYKSSLEARGYYWRAAMKMLIDHPFFGVGMDSYGDWFRRSRPADYFTNGFFSVSNTAHNVPLDIAASGGFPLIALYCAVLAVVILSIVKVAKRSLGFDVYFAAVVGAWAAYQVQSFVSINQLGLAVWGWVLSGLIVGYEINTRVKIKDETKSAGSKNLGKGARNVKQNLSSAAVISLFAGVLIGAFVAIPPYYASANYFSALKTGDLKVIQAAAYIKPFAENRFTQVAATLQGNKLEAEAIAVARDGTSHFPDSIDLWQLWASIPSAAPSDVANAKAQVARLDPMASQHQ
ncbi:MAG: O-antigen ligase family protein [Methylotenera sp.]|nr:MAG: O-antigen ligase family protein [Methylotenera sp.]